MLVMIGTWTLVIFKKTTTSIFSLNSTPPYENNIIEVTWELVIATNIQHSYSLVVVFLRDP